VSGKEIVKLYLGLVNEASRYEDLSGNGHIAPPFLILAVVGGEPLDSRPYQFIPRETAPRTVL
jgi:hypothetical protein